VRFDMAESRGNSRNTRVDASSLSLWIGIGVGILAILAAVSAAFRTVAGADNSRLNLSSERVFRDPNGSMCSGAMSAKGPRQIGAPEGGATLVDRWAREHSVADPGVTQVEIIAQASKGADIVLKRIDVIVDDRSPALRLNSYVLSPGCGGAANERFFFIDLDRSGPTVVPQSSVEAGKVLKPAIDFPYRISTGDPEVFHVTAVLDSSTRSVKWHMEIVYVIDGQQKTKRIDSSGSSFITSGEANAKHYVWNGPTADGNPWTAVP
jgi:hypothetical protein